MSPDENAAPDPTYEEVCQRNTTYVEVFHMKFDHSKISYEDLVKHFFTFHDPTTLNKQEQD